MYNLSLKIQQLACCTGVKSSEIKCFYESCKNIPNSLQQNTNYREACFFSLYTHDAYVHIY